MDTFRGVNGKAGIPGKTGARFFAAPTSTSDAPRENSALRERNFVLQSKIFVWQSVDMNATEAEEHLRIIRSLMERATIYRAISAPTALVGGLASLLAGGVSHFLETSKSRLATNPEDAGRFLFIWSLVLFVTAAANWWFLRREAGARGGQVFSPAMKKALGALFPPMFAGGILTLCVFSPGGHVLLPMIWMIFYGLGLLSAGQFSPQAIPRLGWAFLLAGLATAALTAFLTPVPAFLASPHLLMATSFGGLHLLYAACTWKTSQAEPAHG